MLADSGTAPERRSQDELGTGVPVLEHLRPLIPAGQLERGTIVTVADRTPPAGQTASTYLALAMLAGATASGHYCAVVGFPDLGIAAADALGADLGKILLIDNPGERWAEVVSVLALAVDMILLRPPAAPTAEHLRRIGSRIRVTPRQPGTILVVAGPWAGAHLRLATDSVEWTGIGRGSGHLAARRVTIAAQGRGTAGRQRTMRVLLPAPDGSLQPADTDERGNLLPGEAGSRFARPRLEPRVAAAG